MEKILNGHVTDIDDHYFFATVCDDESAKTAKKYELKVAIHELSEEQKELLCVGRILKLDTETGDVELKNDVPWTPDQILEAKKRAHELLSTLNWEIDNCVMCGKPATGDFDGQGLCDDHAEEA